MAIHPADKRSNNPRLQCSCCAKWMRLHGTRISPATGKPEMFYRFYGGCGYTNGDHLAGALGKDGTRDVCDACCHVECKKLAGCDCQAPFVESGAALVSEACPVHNRLTAQDIENQQYYTDEG